MAALSPRVTLAAMALVALVGAELPRSPIGRLRASPAAGPVAQAAAPRRIVSLIPATTEMLFAIGVGDRIVGVGAYDRFPPDVDRYPRVGGLLDPNVERILSLEPDLAIVYETQTDLIAQLGRAGIPIFRYRHRGLSDITETIRVIAARVGAAAAGTAAAERIERELEIVRRRVRGRPRPRTLLVFGREPGSLRRIDASGGYGFLHDLLEIAGGDDVLSDFKRQSVQIGTELILARAPAVIVELQYGDSPRRRQLDAEVRVWDALLSVPAVRHKRVHILAGDEFVVPGPRIAAAADRFARVLHPEAFP